jgi:DNA-binding NarL/FixJ family response regulator
MILETIAIEIEAIKNLTDREHQIMHLLAEGMLNHQIGQALSISTHTVKNHKKNIKTKLKIADCNSLLKVAIKYSEYWQV